jgi:hypothetical protein
MKASTNSFVSSSPEDGDAAVISLAQLWDRGRKEKEDEEDDDDDDDDDEEE